MLSVMVSNILRPLCHDCRVELKKKRLRCSALCAIVLWLSDHKDLIILVCDLKHAVKAIAAQRGGSLRMRCIIF